MRRKKTGRSRKKRRKRRWRSRRSRRTRISRGRRRRRRSRKRSRRRRRGCPVEGGSDRYSPFSVSFTWLSISSYLASS